MAQLNIIKTTEDLSKLEDKLKEYEYVSYDTETTGITSDAKIIGLSMCGSLEESYYVILSCWDVDKKEVIDLETKDKIKNILSILTTKKLIMHNSVFDCMKTKYNFGIDLMPYVHTDTMILGHILNENRKNGLKELGAGLFGDSVRDEQIAMKDSVHKNGGMLTKDHYELYKADADLIAKYGAQDALLTLRLFYAFIPELYEQKLDQFFFDDESMPLLKGPTYELNSTGLRVDPRKLSDLRAQLEVECMDSKALINKDIEPYVKSKYPGLKKTDHFNIDSNNQLSWLLFEILGNYFITLTDGGKEFCRDNNLKIPYTNAAKREFMQYCRDNKGYVYNEGKFNPKTKKVGRPLKVKDFWTYTSSDKNTLAKFSDKYRWVAELLKYNKNMTILSTYVIGIQDRMEYNIIHPSFIQHGTTSGRYSSKNPNFQNLPRDDKRVKACIVSRPDKVFVGADYAQLEPRVFAYISGDDKLMKSFASGEDFYSVVGAPIFDKKEYSMIKSDTNSFASKFPKLRDKAKVIALATPYGRTASFTAEQMGVTREEAQTIMDRYFQEYPKVELMMLESHEEAKSTGIVYSLFGRPRRIPDALNITDEYGNTQHKDLPYAVRNILNLAMNHRVQSTAASIVNRASIEFYKEVKRLKLQECQIVLQVHDELVVECKESDQTIVTSLLKRCMEQTVQLSGVKLTADPKVAKNLADLK